MNKLFVLLSDGKTVQQIEPPSEPRPIDGLILPGTLGKRLNSNFGVISEHEVEKFQSEPFQSDENWDGKYLNINGTKTRVFSW